MSAVEFRESEGPVSDETLLALGGSTQQIFHAAAQPEWTPVDPSVPGLRPWRAGRLLGRIRIAWVEASTIIPSTARRYGQPSFAVSQVPKSPIPDGSQDKSMRRKRQSDAPWTTTTKVNVSIKI